MKSKGTLYAYVAYMLCMLLLNALIFVTPVLQMHQNPFAGAFYEGLRPFCHQLTSRSLCLTPSYSIVDCMPQDGTLSYSHENVVLLEDGSYAYKLPVCARDVAIYLAMLLGGAILPFVRKVQSTQMPNKWLLAIALVPMAIDGTAQLVGLYESTNMLRLITGSIAGFALQFYIIPMLNMAADNIFSHFPSLHKILFK